ncbi:MAG: histidine kinase [Bacteroidales bacterium]|nr:histidine kinase [Bacteroidales bacterium]
MKSYEYILICLLILANGTLRSQHYLSRNFTMQDGLPSNSIRAIHKDSKGYLWVGTDAGLCRFDGKQFKIYGRDEGFTGNRIWAIAEDNSGNMWFGDYGTGLYRFDGKEFIHISEKDSLTNNYVRKLYYCEKWNILLIGTQKGFTVYDGTTFNNFNKENGKLQQDAYVTGFLENKNDIFICTFSDDNFLYSPKNSKLSTVHVLNHLYGRKLISCFKTTTNQIIIAFRNGIKIIKDQFLIDSIIVPVKAPQNKDIGQIFEMAEDDQGKIWLASWEYTSQNPGGLFLYDGKKVTKKNEILGKEPIAGWAIHFDQDEKILWFGTLDMGLFMIYESQFEYITPEKFGLERLCVNDIGFDSEGKLIILDKKNLIIGYDDTLFRTIPNTQFYWAYKKFLRKINKDNNIYNYQTFLKNFEFRNMAIQNDSTLWVSSSQGIYIINSIHYKVKYCLNGGHYSGDIFFDGEGRFCSAESWGIFGIFEDIENLDDQYDLTKNKIWPKDLSDYLFLNNELWLTSYSNGLYKGSNYQYTNYNSSNSSLINTLNVLCADASGHLIIGGNNGEVYFAKPGKDSLNIFKTFDVSDGILGNSIAWLTADKNNRLWIGTNTGLNMLDLDLFYRKDSIFLRYFDHSEGYSFPSVNVSQIDNSGNIWLGYDGGLTKLYIAKVQEDIPRIPDIIMKSISINGEVITTSDNPDQNLLLDLDHDQNYLGIDFDVINYNNPGKDLFRYRLGGLNSSWSMFTPLRQAVFPHLPPGSYTLQIESKNLNTGLYSKTLSLGIRIRPPFWQSTWFIISGFALVLFLSVFFYRNRIAKTRREEQKKAEVSKQLAELEMKALLAQMNPHFTFNAINSIQNYILDNDVDAALSYLSDFSKIIRQTLENATKEFITLEEELEYIKRYLRLEHMRFDKEFTYAINTDEQIDPETTLIPPMILQPYVENAIKHGLRHKKDKGRLSVKFQLADDEKLLCIIEDNGIGRKGSAAINQKIQKDHNSSGMAITKNRVNKLKEIHKSDLFSVRIVDLISDSNQPAGTRVELILPFTQSI